MAIAIENERGGAKARTARSARESGIDNAGPGVASRSRSLGFGSLITLIIYGLIAATVMGAIWWVISTWKEGRAAVKEVEATIAACPSDLRDKGAAGCLAAVNEKFADFVAETKRIGEEAKAKAEAEIKRQKEVSHATEKSYERRLAAVNDAYRRLRDGRAGSGRSDVPAVPTAPIIVDDASSRDRLLEVLYHADRNTSQLIELQEWVRAQDQK